MVGSNSIRGGFTCLLIGLFLSCGLVGHTAMNLELDDHGDHSHSHQEDVCSTTFEVHTPSADPGDVEPPTRTTVSPQLLDPFRLIKRSPLTHFQPNAPPSLLQLQRFLL